MSQPPPNTTTVVHASLGSLSQGSSFASSGGSCCGPPSRSNTTVVVDNNNINLHQQMLARQECDELDRAAGAEESSDSVAPLKSARPPMLPLPPKCHPLPIDCPSSSNAHNGFCTSTTVLNGAGSLSLFPEQKSRSLINLNVRTATISHQQRSISPINSPRQPQSAEAIFPKLQKYKYGSLRHLPANPPVLRQISTTEEFSNNFSSRIRIPPNGLRLELTGPGGAEENVGEEEQMKGGIGIEQNGEKVAERGSQRRLFPRQQEMMIAETRNSDIRLQQSLSTPSTANDPAALLLNGTNKNTGPSSGGGRKDSEYRRFRSEGSTTAPAGSLAPHSGDMPADLPLDSPIIDPRSSPPNRLNLFQQDTMVTNGGTLTKHSHTEQVMMMHTLKTKLQKYQTFIDKAFQLIQQGPDEQVFEGCTIVTKVMTKAWLFPKISQDLAYALCDYLKEQGYLDELLGLFTRTTISDSVRLCCGRVLEECLANNNCEAVMQKGFLKKVVATAEKLNKNQEQQRISLSLMEALFKHSSETTSKLIEMGIIDHILLTCKRATDTPGTLRHAALALANLALYSSQEAKKKLIQKKLPDWLFLLASQPDDITRYYACLAICVLGSASTNSKEMELAVAKSGTLTLVEPFLISHTPTAFAQHDYKHSQGRPREWLARLLPMLASKCREAKSMAAFHLCVEAIIKKEQQKLEMLADIGAIQALKECASSPDELPAKFASEALTIIGEQVPYKLSQQVPCWSIKDVQYWVEKIGFGTYSQTFASHMVDGDLLLLLTEKELEEDLEMRSGLLRKRFMRELESLKIAADYSSVDETHLDQFLMSLSPELSVYTYQMLGMGLNRNLLPQLTNDMMKSVCCIHNPIHRLKLRQALQDSKHIDDIEVAILSKQIDVFISYRRSTGNQLASLIKVLLQLRGYKVFIDVDKLYAGKFDSHLLKNIQAAKHFILVLTPHSLDRLLNDNNCEDWIHKELHCAFEHGKNVIPIFDQHFEFPAIESELPDDIRQITRFNGVRWVHDYQEACIDKVERFIKGELNRVPSQSLSLTKASGSASAGHLPGSSSVSVVNRRPYKLSGPTNTNAGQQPSSTTGGPSRCSPTPPSGIKLQRMNGGGQIGVGDSIGSNASGSIRSASIEKRKKLFSSVSTVNSETIGR